MRHCLPTRSMLDLYGTPTLLTHGDALCTDDTAYQIFRQQVRNVTWQQQFLALPLAHRIAQIEQLRAKSESEKQLKVREYHGCKSSGRERVAFRA
jgi:UDP-2,3-diacylglucosamine hydrolase